MSTGESPESKDQPGEFTRFFKPVLRPSPPKPGLQPEKPATSAKEAPPPGEFTQMFAAPAKPPEAGSMPGAPVTVPEPATPKAAEKQPQRPERAFRFQSPEAKPEPGEFTRMFKAPVAPQADVPALPNKPAEAFPQPEVKTGPGDFTRMFSAVPAAKAAEPPPATPPPAKPPPGPAAPPPAPGQESEFTRFFKNPLPSTGRRVDWKAIEDQPSSLPAAKGPGEFTRMFGRAERPASKENATDLFQNSNADSGAKKSPAQVDDFAKIFAQTPTASEPKAAAPAPVQPAPAPAKPVTTTAIKPAGPPAYVLVIIIAAVLVLAACALYYFVFRK